ncbi:hypothetical protein ACQ4PT_025722 [Festuca glaucescens]
MDPKDRSKSKEANIGGLMILLLVWCWEHLPVGQPAPLGYDRWVDHGDPKRMATWAWHWDKVEGFFGISKTQYLHYVNELDAMLPEHVTWEPYGTAGNIGRNITFALNPKCLHESHLWRLRGPLLSTCSIDKIKKKGIKNWSKEHKVHIKRFLHKIDKIEQRMLRGTPPPAPRPFDTAAFNRYLMWFRGVARTQLNPPAFQSEDILLEPNPSFDEMANLEYNKLIRLEDAHN